MYITFFRTAKAKQITFEDVINNPYLSVKDAMTYDERVKRVTTIVNKGYGRELWSKAERPDFIAVMPENFKTEEHYSTFRIPKKSNPNKYRTINAPDEMLSHMQDYCKHFLDALRVIPHDAAHAYVNNRSTVTAMQKHQRNKSKWFLQIDLKDFFDSINEDFLRKMLSEVYPFPFLDPKDLDHIIKLALLNGTLPQGSKLSPQLTNYVMVPIDYAIKNTLNNHKNHHFVYTRYADDITISCKEKFNPNEILKIIKKIFREWEVPFKINNDKTRFGSSAGRNYHLGLIINKDNKLSVGHEKNNKFRAKINNFCLVGSEWDIQELYKLQGLISYYRAVEPDFIKKTLTKYGKKYNINVEETLKKLLASYV